MEISEIRVKLVSNPKERLKAVCSVTFEGAFVIRDLKVIEGASGLFVAMPSRKLADHCPKCRTKNHLRARFCNECGQKLDERRADRVRGGRARLHADIAHPIHSECRNHIQAQVVEAYQKELERSKQPGYQPAEYDDFEVEAGSEYHDLVADLKKEAEQRHGRRAERGPAGLPAGGETEAAADTIVPAVAADEPSRVSASPAPPPTPSPAAPAEDDFAAGIV
ncbi:MAG: SpoVG family protein [Planctomycetota bacterium]